MPETKTPLYLLKNPDGSWRFPMLGTDCPYPSADGTHDPASPTCNGTGRVAVETGEALSAAAETLGRPVYRKLADGHGWIVDIWHHNGIESYTGKGDTLKAALEAALEAAVEATDEN